MSGTYFDGATSVSALNLGSESVDSDQLLIHFWFNPRTIGTGNSVHSNDQYILHAGNFDFRVWLESSNQRMVVGFEDDAGVALASALSPAQTFDENSGWVSVDILGDATNDFFAVYFNGLTAMHSALSATGSGTIDLSYTNWEVGGKGDPGSLVYNGDLFQLAVYNGWSSDYVSSKGALTPKYITEMYDIGSDGSLYPKTDSIASVAGGSPIILLESDYSSFVTNNGVYGDFGGVNGNDLTPSVRALPSQ